MSQARTAVTWNQLPFTFKWRTDSGGSFLSKPCLRFAGSPAVQSPFIRTYCVVGVSDIVLPTCAGIFGHERISVKVIRHPLFPFVSDEVANP
jgi:hypothetical protein